MSRAVCLLSGGLDSTTCLALALSENDKVTAVSFDYGQKHVRELQAASAVCSYYREAGYDLEHLTLILPELFAGSESALVGKMIEMPQLTYQQIAEGQGPSPTVVPFRNPILISIATALAITRDADLLYCGMHGEDARGFAYPDCTPMALGPMAAVVWVGSYHKVTLKVPFQWYMKADVVREALRIEARMKLPVPLWRTWSCYRGGEKHCGLCPTCVERRAAFAANDLPDPVEYEE